MSSHKFLPVSIFSCFLLLIFIFGFSWFSFRVSSIDIIRYLGAQVGSAMGVSVAVPPNPFNTLAQQLKEKEVKLQQKEGLLEQREAELEAKDFARKGKVILDLIVGLITVLFVLILLNFYFDYKRKKSL